MRKAISVVCLGLFLTCTAASLEARGFGFFGLTLDITPFFFKSAPCYVAPPPPQPIYYVPVQPDVVAVPTAEVVHHHHYYH